MFSLECVLFRMCYQWESVTDLDSLDTVGGLLHWGLDRVHVFGRSVDSEVHELQHQDHRLAIPGKYYLHRKWLFTCELNIKIISRPLSLSPSRALSLALILSLSLSLSRSFSISLALSRSLTCCSSPVEHKYTGAGRSESAPRASSPETQHLFLLQVRMCSL